jgi:Transmembrane secretion effector
VFALPPSPRLRRILLAYTVNQLGTWFGYFALSLGIYDHTHSALAVAGMFVAARGLPALLAPALVASTELFEGRGGLSRLYLVEALAALGLAALLTHFWLPGLLVLVAIDGTAALTASALLRATGAHVAAEEAAEDDDVEVAQRKVNAAFNFAFTGTLAVVPLIVGLVVETAGAPTALLINAATFVACAALLGAVRPHAEDADGTSVRARLLAAWRYLNEMPQLRSLLLIEAVAVVFFASVEPVEVLYAKQTLAVGDRGYGLLVDVWGIGMVLGSIVFARAVRRPLGPMLVVGTLLVGLAYLGFAVAPTLAVACAAALVGGAGNGAQWPSLISAVQQLTPKALHGRLMSAVESIGSLCPAIGFALGGAITALSSPRVAMLVAGVAATAITGLFVRISRSSFRLERPAEATVSTDAVASNGRPLVDSFPQPEGPQVPLDVGR